MAQVLSFVFSTKFFDYQIKLMAYDCSAGKLGYILCILFRENSQAEDCNPGTRSDLHLELVVVQHRSSTLGLYVH